MTMYADGRKGDYDLSSTLVNSMALVHFRPISRKGKLSCCHFSGGKKNPKTFFSRFHPKIFQFLYFLFRSKLWTIGTIDNQPYPLGQAM
jgi:hypothetical protein